MATSSWRAPAAQNGAERPLTPREARCTACGGWIASGPPGTRWLRGKCGNRRCAQYDKAQTVRYS